MLLALRQLLEHPHECCAVERCDPVLLVPSLQERQVFGVLPRVSLRPLRPPHLGCEVLADVVREALPGSGHLLEVGLRRSTEGCPKAFYAVLNRV
jgi:hypothetical protein